MGKAFFSTLLRKGVSIVGFGLNQKETHTATAAADAMQAKKAILDMKSMVMGLRMLGGRRKEIVERARGNNQRGKERIRGGRLYTR